MPIQNVFNAEDSILWECGAMLVVNGVHHFKNHSAFVFRVKQSLFGCPLKGSY
jgi:hypothetical protein